MVAFAVSGCCKDKDEDELGTENSSHVDENNVPDNTFVVNVADNDSDVRCDLCRRGSDHRNDRH